MSAPQRKLRGLEKICRAYGRMKCGDTLMLWDYANEKAVPESEMPDGGERWMASERAKHAAVVAAKSPIVALCAPESENTETLTLTLNYRPKNNANERAQT